MTHHLLRHATILARVAHDHRHAWTVAVAVALGHGSLRLAGFGFRRTLAALLIAGAVAVIRLAILLLPEDAPTRIFVVGLLNRCAVSMVDVARHRPTANG